MKGRSFGARRALLPLLALCGVCWQFLCLFCGLGTRGLVLPSASSGLLSPSFAPPAGLPASAFDSSSAPGRAFPPLRDAASSGSCAATLRSVRQRRALALPAAVLPTSGDDANRQAGWRRSTTPAASTQSSPPAPTEPASSRLAPAASPESSAAASVLTRLRGGRSFFSPAPSGPPPPALPPSPNLFVVKATHVRDPSVVFLAPQDMASLQLQRGDVVLLAGRRKRETLGVVLPDKTLESKQLLLHAQAAKNLKLHPQDVVKVTPRRMLPHARRVYVLPFADSLQGLGDRDAAPGGDEGNADAAGERRRRTPREKAEREADAGDLPSVESVVGNFFRHTARPAKVGDQFLLEFRKGDAPRAAAESGNTPAGKLEVKVMQIDTDGKEDQEMGIIDDNTEIICEGEPLDRGQFDSSSMITYDDVGGLKKELTLIRELVELPLRFPEIFKQVGVQTPRGVLLHGSSGCGKTLLAKAIANECGANFLTVNGPEIMSKLAGESEANLRRIFEEAAALSPCLLFIDEIDSIASNREKTQGEVEKRIVAQLLTLMDGVSSDKNIVVLAATNRPNQLDPALRRFGRFDREIEIPIPDEQGRKEILQKAAANMNLNEDVDLEKIAKDAHGFVGADLAQLCLEAAMQCVRENCQFVDFDKDEIDPETLARFQVRMPHFVHALSVVNPSALRERHVEVPDVRWEDIGGLEEVKQELVETVQYPVEHGEKFHKFGLAPSKGVLFYGPPGCGKTLLAKAVANECKANFISVKGPELLTMWFGESEANVRDLFDKARAAAPCVIFFDEMDSVAKARGSGTGGGGEAADRVINQILTEIDGIGKRKPIFVIGATNRPDILDPAVTRPGRLDQLLYIPLPDFPSRVNIFKAALRKSPLAPDVDIEGMAKRLEGFSGADITEICQRAAKNAVREAIQAELARGRPLEKGEKDPVPFIAKKHFDEAFKYARRSVPEDTVKVYAQFNNMMKKRRAPNEKDKEGDTSS
ncbi:cell division protein CDC48AP [Besnoitia besnoiti]|uniref:Cell division protein CDC48AP n=1 Tax=Besnoitia besnoiti TaxID=94643 RepID=A0A2A9M968_BESBE|nr:cell division protein CDC48AP [Besnoitia besnoiti]PFH31930.1 cell division protein CDC48AP [Besnoitia besnoiti]